MDPETIEGDYREFFQHFSRHLQKNFCESTKFGNFTYMNPVSFPFDPDKKIFRKYCCDEDECICPVKYESFNDQIKFLDGISGVNEELK